MNFAGAIVLLYLCCVFQVPLLQANYVQFGERKALPGQPEYYLMADAGTSDVGAYDDLKRTHRSFWRNLFTNSGLKNLFGRDGCNNCYNENYDNNNVGYNAMPRQNSYDMNTPFSPLQPLRQIQSFQPLKALEPLFSGAYPDLGLDGDEGNYENNEELYGNGYAGPQNMNNNNYGGPDSNVYNAEMPYGSNNNRKQNYNSGTSEGYGPVRPNKYSYNRPSNNYAGENAGNYNGNLNNYSEQGKNYGKGNNGAYNNNNSGGTLNQKDCNSNGYSGGDNMAMNSGYDKYNTKDKNNYDVNNYNKKNLGYGAAPYNDNKNMNGNYGDKCDDEMKKGDYSVAGGKTGNEYSQDSNKASKSYNSTKKHGLADGYNNQTNDNDGEDEDYNETNKSSKSKMNSKHGKGKKYDSENNEKKDNDDDDDYEENDEVNKTNKSSKSSKSKAYDSKGNHHNKKNGDDNGDNNGDDDDDDDDDGGNAGDDENGKTVKGSKSTKSGKNKMYHNNKNENDGDENGDDDDDADDAENSKTGKSHSSSKSPKSKVHNSKDDSPNEKEDNDDGDDADDDNDNENEKSGKNYNDKKSVKKKEDNEEDDDDDDENKGDQDNEKDDGNDDENDENKLYKSMHESLNEDFNKMKMYSAGAANEERPQLLFQPIIYVSPQYQPSKSEDQSYNKQTYGSNSPAQSNMAYGSAVKYSGAAEKAVKVQYNSENSKMSMAPTMDNSAASKVNYESTSYNNAPSPPSNNQQSTPYLALKPVLLPVFSPCQYCNNAPIQPIISQNGSPSSMTAYSATATRPDSSNYINAAVTKDNSNVAAEQKCASSSATSQDSYSNSNDKFSIKYQSQNPNHNAYSGMNDERKQPNQYHSSNNIDSSAHMNSYGNMQKSVPAGVSECGGHNPGLTIFTVITPSYGIPGSTAKRKIQYDKQSSPPLQYAPIKMTMADQPYRECPELFSEYNKNMEYSAKSPKPALINAHYIRY
ncbi:probable cyclin-dependent serine/threonine-protein kinase DDB_G0292550 [Teleopsis dalmanni]|uniref:probable cyclin-dependent serine/threonine-protein kinase DDB_G0292550 n=1 Tax=Teleopsis dalmanni TaxID=139649 RepID=UPI0018CEDD98|nr:probable cyclin-dependent serine/threonine-protein kinase DDB_G0292550 [Teleopsis dalmanni]